jgi:hypothetical protein
VLGAAVLGAAVLGAAVLGAAVLGAAVLGAAVLGAAVLGAAVLGAAVLGVLLVVVALGAPAEIAGVAGPVPPGENGVGVVDGEPPAQADTDAVASMAKAAQLRTVPRKRRRP